ADRAVAVRPPGEPLSGPPEAHGSDGGGNAFEEGEIACLRRAKLDPIPDVLAYPRCRHRRCRLGFLVGLPHADGHTGAIAEVGEPVPDESGLRSEGGEHPVLRLFSELRERALDDLVVRDTYRLHTRGSLG